MTRTDSFRNRDLLVTVGAYAAAACTMVAVVTLMVSLAAYGWNEVGFVLSTSGLVGVMRPLGVTAIIVLVAFPITFLVGLFSAAATNDPTIGGLGGKALRESIEGSSGIPPVVIGAAVYFCGVALRNQHAIIAAIVALVLLNMPNAAGRLTLAVGSVPRQAREAGAALGASPVTSFFQLLAPRAAWSIAGAGFALVAQMVGETSAVAIATGTTDGPLPLSVKIWQFASNASLMRSEAASCIVLVAIVGLLLALSRFCLRRNLQTSWQPR